MYAQAHAMSYLPHALVVIKREPHELTLTLSGEIDTSRAARGRERHLASGYGATVVLP